jgi:hypothetical protein
MRNGYVCGHPTWVPRIGASGGSVWPTAKARDYKGSRTDETHFSDLDKRAEHWPTPRVGGHGEQGAHKSPTGNLDALEPAAIFWATPNTSNGGQSMSAEDVAAKGATAKGKRQVGLESQTKHWPTPTSTDQKSSGAANYSTESGRHSGTTLTDACRYFHPDPPTTTNGEPSSSTPPTSRQRLNPAFVCWLMGNLWWWTRAEPISFGALEMESWRYRQRWHLRYLLGELD